MSFSKRIGITLIAKPLQLKDIDTDLRNSLWSLYDVFIVQSFDSHSPYVETEEFEPFVNDLYYNFLKKPLDRAPSKYYQLRDVLRNYMLNEVWFNVYNLIDFTLTCNSRNKLDDENFINALNKLLEREFSGYRIIDGLIAPISNELELDEIKEALENVNNYSSISTANIHLKNALECISNKENPDYRNAIKESISAVETTVRFITNEKTLGDGLRKFEGSGLKLNNQLKESFSKIYNYTNDKNAGIRHGIIGEHDAPDYETAKYLLVTSSAFINYLVGLAVKNGLFKGSKAL